jgi:anti-repressor protein
MKELVKTNTMNELTMNLGNSNDLHSSRYLVEQINIFRKEEGNRAELAHFTLLSKIESEFVDEIADKYILVSEYKDKSGKSNKMYELNYEQSLQILMSESKTVRKAVIEVLKTKNKPQIPQTYAQALRLAADQQDVIEQQQEQLQLQAPKVEFADDIKASVNSIEIGEFAQTLGISGLGRNNMYKLFRSESILKFDNTPYQYYIDNGTLEKDPRTRKNFKGEKEIYFVTMMTPKGIQYFTDFLKKCNYI